MKIEDLYDAYSSSQGISTDTRSITPRSVFFALKGPRFNANEFAKQALDKGAAFAVVDDAAYATDPRIFVVEDGLKALQDLARFHRSKLNIPVLALTGSNGKTTSKELVSAVLAQKFTTHATKGNLNNHIGVPLTILSIDSHVELAVVEMGANHVGEIASLCSIAMPTHGFITNIGKAHIGTFGGFENIIKGKTELFDHLQKAQGVVFANSGNEILKKKAGQLKNVVWYPGEGDYYRCKLVSSDPMLLVEAENGERVQTQLTGAYNFENVAAALCIGKYFGVDPAKANAAIAAYAPSNMRSQVVKSHSNTIILDAYNANPSSMAAAIENLAAMKADKKVLILGDMFELEEEADKEHRAIAKLLKERGFRDVYLCGSLFGRVLDEVPFARHFEKKDALLAQLKSQPIQGATILVKASRGIGLESVVEFL